MSLRDSVQNQLKRYLPEAGIDQVVDLICKHKVQFKIKRPRSTKLGDYRPPLHIDYHKISVNGNLNPYAFYLTSIHEFAHLENFIQNGRKVAPHGIEWKTIFSNFLIQGNAYKWFPEDISKHLIRYINNPKASSCTDQHLYAALRKHDKKQMLPLLKELPKGSIFVLQNKLFERGELQRTRIKCKEIKTGKLYLVNAIAEVTLIPQDNEK